ncbi:MAG: putative multidrug resistance protein family [Gammaproteobacteria bacterium]|jgi:MFS family permease|nr:putative multidrug resistance protein family [Gammaproteobacteria bacterium]
MDNSVTAQLKRYRLHTLDLGQSRYLYLLSNLLPVAATALLFFLPYYFVTTLQFSLLQAGLLMSLYGVGIFIAILLTPYLKRQYSPRKIILFSLFANCIALACFLYIGTFPPLCFNLVLLGFAGYLFKNSHTDLLLQQHENGSPTQAKIVQQSYMASNIGLGLAMSIIALFAVSNFKALFMAALLLNALPLFFLPRDTQENKPKPTTLNLNPPIFSLLLLFLGGLLLSQFTATYSIYLCLKFPHVGLTSMATFMAVNVFLISWLQKPILNTFNRGSALLRAGLGALLLGLGCYVISLAHVFSLIILSAMIVSLGEIFFISSLHSLCPRLFQGTLTLSLIVGASLGTYVYQSFGANTVWQSCAYLGIVCFGLVLVKAVIAKVATGFLKNKSAALPGSQRSMPFG